MRVNLNIGSNTGDRLTLIGRAVALLARDLPPGRIFLSDYIETPPWGYESPNPFLNRGLLYITDAAITPLEILDITQCVEKIVGDNAPHRNADGSYCDRPIDIDIIDIDGIVLDSPRLTLPHPRAHLRPFVTIPLGQLSGLS